MEEKYKIFFNVNSRQEYFFCVNNFGLVGESVFLTLISTILQEL